jgi:nucleoid-associated protein YgaU
VIEKVITALAAVATLGFVAGALMASETQRGPVDPAVEAKTVTVIMGARPTSARTQKARPVRYVVKRGDTLWAIAARHYDDVAEGMRRIRVRNGLKREHVLAGEVLVLPAAGRR